MGVGSGGGRLGLVSSLAGSASFLSRSRNARLQPLPQIPGEIVSKTSPQKTPLRQRQDTRTQELQNIGSRKHVVSIGYKFFYLNVAGRGQV